MIPKLIITMLLENNWIKMTEVNPSKAFPHIFCASEIPPRITETSSMITPKTVTICIGAVENEEMLLSAYLTSERVDHLDSPVVRS